MTGSSSGKSTGYHASVSPYLLRPLRTYEQALADIEAKRRSVRVVQPFVPVLVASTPPADDSSGVIAA